jgi:MATE family multidrug resistance protein
MPAVHEMAPVNEATETTRLTAVVVDDAPDRVFEADESSNFVSRAARSFIAVPPHMKLREMLSELAVNVVPAAVTTLLFFANQAITTMVVGRVLGTVVLAQYTVGQSIFNACGLSLAHGMATALDTLCSQSYGRQQQGPELGELFQRSLVVCIGMNIPVMIFFFYCDPVTLAVFGPEIGPGVAQFLHWCPIYLVLVTVYKCLQKTLQSQKLPRIPLTAAVCATISCPFFNYWFTHRGLHGAVMAIMLSQAVACGVMILGSLLHPAVIIYQAKFPSPKALEWEGIKEFISVGCPSLFSVCSEWWVFQILIGLVATLGNEEIAAFTIAFNVILIQFSIPQGFSIALGVLVGNEMGANNPAGARAYSRLGLLGNACFTLLNSVLLYSFSNAVWSCYTIDHEVHVALNSALWGVIGFVIGDSTQAGMQGSFRGVTRQRVCARVVLVTLWMVGLPASFVYVLEMRMRLIGIFLGEVTGFLIEIPTLLYDMWHWDWEELAQQASHRPSPTTAGAVANYGGTKQKEVA